MIEWYIYFAKMFFLSFCIIYSTIKILGYETNCKEMKIKLLILNIVISLIYSFIRKYIENSLAYMISYFLLTFILLIIININLIKGMITTIISSTFSLIAMFIAISINFLVLKYSRLDITGYRIEECICIGIIQLVLIIFFFKIKRFKDGFTFLKNNKTNQYPITLILISIVISLTFILIGKNAKDILIDTYCTIGGGIGILFMTYWLKTSITKYYKERMKDRTVELQSEQLKEKDKIISNLNQELSNVLGINHKYNKRLSAMEKAIGNFGDKLSLNEEFAKEYSDILDSLKDLSKEYKQEFENYNILPKTNIFSIDNLLDYMKTEAIRNNIEFELEINEDINELIEKNISKNKLETLLGDHITDAIIAINASDNYYKKIKVIIGKDKEFYKISILDTGIEFEIETLLKLGLERITTHKDSGGTGIGFMTTFETLKECKASLVIEEYNNEKDYTKSVNVIFDEKSEYNISSYRAERINYKTRTIQ